jgi:hypothetical protein
MARISIPDEPYTPYPTAQPTDARTPNIPVQVTPGAFGGQIGDALRGFGSTMGEVGNELARSAIQMQEIKNESESNEAATKYMVASGEAQEKFQTLQGKDPHDQLMAHLDAQAKLRNDVRGNLSNDAVRRSFDRETLGAFRQYTIRSSGHAAGQLKQYNTQTGLAQIEIAKRDVERRDVPDDEFRDISQKVFDKAATIARSEGKSPDVIKNERQKLESELMVQRVKGRSTSDIQGALDLLKQNSSRVDPTTYNQLTAQLQGKLIPIVANSAGGNTNENPKTIGIPPGIRPDEKQTLYTAPPIIRDLYSTFSFQNQDKDYRVQGAPGNGLSIASEDPEGDMAKINEIAKGINLPIETKVVDGRVQVNLPGGYDQSKAPSFNTQSRSDRNAWAAGWAVRNHPDIETIGQRTEARSDAIGKAKEAQERDVQRQNINAVYSVLGEHEGMTKAKDEQEIIARLIKDHGNSRAWDDLDEKNKDALRKHLLTPDAMHDDLRTYANYLGMSPEDWSYKDPMDVINDNHLTAKTKEKFLGIQAAIKKANGDVNPQLSGAMRILSPGLDDTILKDPDNLKLYRGMLDIELTAEAMETKAAVKPERVRKIGEDLQKKMITQGAFGGFFGPGEQPLYQKQPTDVELNGIRDTMRRQTGNEPADFEVLRSWVRDQVRKAEQGAEVVAKPGTKTQPPATAPAPPTMTQPVTPTEEPTTAGPTGAYTGGRAQKPEEVTTEQAAETKRRTEQAAAGKATIEKARPELRAPTKPTIDTAERRASDIKTLDAQLKQTDEEEKEIRGRDWTRKSDMERALRYLENKRNDLRSRRKELE